MSENKTPAYSKGETWSQGWSEREWRAECYDAPGGTQFATVKSDRYADPVAIIPIALDIFDGGQLIDARARLIAASPTVVERYLTKLALWADFAEQNPAFRDDLPVYSASSADGDIVWTLGELKEARALLSRIRGEST